MYWVLLLRRDCNQRPLLVEVPRRIVYKVLSVLITLSFYGFMKNYPYPKSPKG